MSPSVLKSKCIQHLDGKAESNIEIVNEFLNYMKAYCADLKVTESDILNDEELFSQVYHLFDVVILQKKYQYN